MGDATKLSEKEILNAGWTVDAEVYRIGHHGSVTSTGKEFIDAVNPEYVVISCGLGNRHKHPDEEVVSMLEEMQLPLYRTDESGTIVMTTDGENIEFDKSPGTYENGEEKGE
jgi:competence protein ComEC